MTSSRMINDGHLDLSFVNSASAREMQAPMLYTRRNMHKVSGRLSAAVGHLTGSNDSSMVLDSADACIMSLDSVANGPAVVQSGFYPLLKARSEALGMQDV